MRRSGDLAPHFLGSSEAAYAVVSQLGALEHDSSWERNYQKSRPGRCAAVHCRQNAWVWPFRPRRCQGIAVEQCVAFRNLPLHVSRLAMIARWQCWHRSISLKLTISDLLILNTGDTGWRERCFRRRKFVAYRDQVGNFNGLWGSLQGRAVACSV